jgi:hypothetical protein
VKEEDHGEDLGVDWRMTLKQILKKKFGGVRTRIIWLRVRTNGEFLRLEK